MLWQIKRFEEKKSTTWKMNIGHNSKHLNANCKFFILIHVKKTI